MIEPALRCDHLARALPIASRRRAGRRGDRYGAHHDPAGILVRAIKDAQKPVIASVTGTEADPQGWSRQVAILRAAGVIVAPSNARAAEAAAALVA
jgi:FdrA protein